MDSPLEHEVANACGRRWIKPRSSNEIPSLTQSLLSTIDCPPNKCHSINGRGRDINNVQDDQQIFAMNNEISSATSGVKRAKLSRSSSHSIREEGPNGQAQRSRHAHCRNSASALLLEQVMWVGPNTKTAWCWINTQQPPHGRVPTIHRAKRGSYSKSMCIISWSFRRGPLSTATLL